MTDDYCRDFTSCMESFDRKQCELTANVEPGKSIEVSKQGIWGRIILLLKRVVRKATHFLTTDQTRFNEKLIENLQVAGEAIRLLENKLGAKDERIAHLELQIQTQGAQRIEKEKQFADAVQNMEDALRQCQQTIRYQSARLEKLTVQSCTLAEQIKENDKQFTDFLKRLDSCEDTLRENLADIAEAAVRLETCEMMARKFLDMQGSISALQSDYAASKLKGIARSEKLADILLELMDMPENQHLKETVDLDDFWNEGKFIMLNKHSYSQTGEDSIIAHIVTLLGIPFDQCTYLDLGANQPKEMSNTYFFYAKGASGVLVEANPYLAQKLHTVRSRDVVLNNCVGVVSGKMVGFNILNVDGLSTQGDVNEIMRNNPVVRVEETVEVESISVPDIAQKYFRQAPTILNIDLEGIEMEVLNSIDFCEFRPLIIITEMIPYSMQLVVGNKNQEIVDYLKDKGYVEYAFTGINSIFLDTHQLQGKAFL